MSERIKHLYINPLNCRGCRSCQLACSFVRANVFNPAKSVISLDRDIKTGHTAPMIMPLKCNFCGGNPACVKACTYEAISLKKEESNYLISICL